MRAISPASFPVPALLLATVVLAGCGRKADGDGAAAPAVAASAAVQTVGVVKVLQADVPVAVEASGTVTALQSVDLRAQTTSTVAQVHVKDGQMVKKGELLFRFDDRADRAALDKARAQLARDRAAQADLERQLGRARELVAQNFIAQSAVDTAQANLDAGLALVRSDEAVVQAAQVALGYNELRAPINGRAGIVGVFPGSLVQASATAAPLVNIAQLDPISIAFSLPETQLGALLEATRNGRLDVEALPPPGSPRGAAAVKGHVTVVDNLVDTTTGTIKVKAEFDNRAQALWPGQYLRVRVTLQTLKGATVIPQVAVILRGSERFVYVVAADNTARLLPVQLRAGLGEQAVVEGLEAGQQVVVDGKQNLRPGTPVKLQAPIVKPAGVAASGAGQ
ncbi:efflux RND transporter periplasmic adaptor subunit [Roseateles saccharophilus]|uniref:RND family efflux transporter MFP subunit n=1 Tax=Roseateles saccharophilus TaxID=304 RepID=A0A4V2VR70_ROSSA|nr:efflux RND transporter periplasmic adaptor subunit [Roseateles saccharophilus]MDG0831907.1 efflux RND transporter periplasmic adaptor subunit [Roseateles saccharophilus]TCU97429.1 RND family efflux transporter MFP subunit [Roseateles saccharophilus]